jgi:carbohydrate-selective porin OprB
VGVVWQKPFGRFSDRAGLAGVWADPVDSRGRDQYAAEFFYRLEVIEGLAITPDVQLIFQPALRPQRDFVGVFGLRTRMVF